MRLVGPGNGATILLRLPGMLTLTLTNPIWVVKTRLCLVSTENVPRHMRYQGLGEGLANLYRYEGIRGLYKVGGVWAESRW